MNDPETTEGFLSTQGLGVIAAILVAGGVTLFAAGLGKASSLVLVLLGAAAAGWAWMRRSAVAGAKSAAAPPAARRPTAPPKPTVAPTVKFVAPEPAPKVAPIAAPVPEAVAAPPLVTDTAEGPRFTGRTVRIENLADLAAGMMPVAHFVITGDGPPRDIWYGKDLHPWPKEIVIGRSPEPGPGEEAIVLSSKAVSALQARLVYQDETYLVENLSRTNTTRVDGKPLRSGERHPLVEGNRIEMGPVTMSYHRS